MDLDNINDIEVLRKAAKCNRVQLNEDVNADEGGYTFKKGYWYLVDQDEHNVFISSENFLYMKTFNYIEAFQYLNKYM